ncbi:MAG: DUF3795 domain-containing protein [Clostridiales bacterium]|nr:DUF3795 domain-containing protein [Clostridiales bacterium]
MRDLTYIGFCGVDCSACPDLENGKCPGCRLTPWKGGESCMPVKCCGKKDIPCCGLCDTFPCPDMAEFYEESEGHKKARALMLALRGEEKV